MAAVNNLQPLQIQRIANPQALASTLHYQHGKSADEVRGMDAQAWGAVAGDSLATQEDVADLLRVYESYQ